MVKIRIKKTGVIQEVTRNIAFDLIDKGVAEIYRGKSPQESPIIEPKIDDRQLGGNIYPNRQMHSEHRDKHSR